MSYAMFFDLHISVFQVAAFLNLASAMLRSLQYVYAVGHRFSGFQLEVDCPCMAAGGMFS